MTAAQIFMVLVMFVILVLEVGSSLDHWNEVRKNKKLPKHRQRDIEPRMNGTEKVIWYSIVMACTYSFIKAFF